MNRLAPFHHILMFLGRDARPQASRILQALCAILPALVPVVYVPPAAAEDPPSPAAAPQPLATVEGISEYALNNGLQVLLFPDRSKPTITVNIVYRVGSRHEGRGEAGMAHLLEHMVFKGTPTFKNIWAALEDHGATFNGTTWVDRTNYYETLPASDENLEFALRMEADRMINSHIAGDDLAREMTVVRNEFEMGENDPSGVLSERMLSAAYVWHNYGQSTIGNRSDIERVPVANLRRFYERYYQPDNATLVVAGSFDPARALAWITQYFGPIPRPQRVLERTYTEEPPQDGARLVTLERVGDVAAAGLVYHVPAGTHEDFAAIQILEGVLTDQPSGRLYKALVQTGLAARVSGQAFAWAEPGVLELSAQIRPEGDARRVLEEMTTLVEGVASASITDEEVERIKTAHLKEYKLSMNDSGRIGIRLSEAVAQGDWRLFFIHRDRIAAVRTADVQRVARSYLVASNRTAGLFIPAPAPSRATIPPTPDVAGIVRNYTGGQALEAGEVFATTPENIEARTRRLTLPSGIRVVVLPKQTRGDAVQASFQFRFGTEEILRGQEVSLRLIPAMLMRGTTRLDHQHLRDEIDRLQSRINVGGAGGGRRGGGGGGDDSGGTLTATIESDRHHVVAAIELLSEILRQPAFNPDQFQTVLEGQLARAEERLSDPRARGMNDMTRALSPWPADSIHYVPTLEEQVERLKAASLGDVRDLYSRLYGASHLTVGLIGDFDEAAVLAAIDKLGSWKSPAPYERVTQPRIAHEPARLKILTPDKEMAVVGMGATFELRDDDPDYPALDFAAYILGESGKSRLINRLRHQGGMSYGANAALRVDSEDRRAALVASAIGAPQSAAAALDAMREEIRRWVADGITADELAEGKSSYALKFKTRLAEDRYVLRELVRGVELNRTLQFRADVLQKIQSLSIDEVRSALQRHLGSAQFVEMQAGDWQRAAQPAEPHAAQGSPESGEDAASAGAEDGPPPSQQAPAVLPERLVRFDENGDGKLQKTEAPPRLQEFFERLDANQDGAIDGAEAAAMAGGRRAGERPE